MYFTIYQDSQKQYRWNLKGNNHEIVANGEGYPQKSSVLHAVALVNGKNGYRVDDQTVTLFGGGLLDSALASHIAASYGLGLSAARPPSLSTFAAQPWVNGVGGLLDHATRKK